MFCWQKQPFRGVLMKKCSEKLHQIYKRTPMLKCDFNKVTEELISFYIPWKKQRVSMFWEGVKRDQLYKTFYQIKFTNLYQIFKIIRVAHPSHIERYQHQFWVRLKLVCKDTHNDMVLLTFSKPSEVCCKFLLLQLNFDLCITTD